MLYITGNTSKTWPTVVRVLIQSEELQMVALLYPGEPVPPAPFFQAESCEDVEPVTTWGDDERPTLTARLAVTAELLDKLACVHNGRFDFAVYRPAESMWVACAIPHEEMVLVRDDQFLESLLEAGFSASTTAPDWW